MLQRDVCTLGGSSDLSVPLDEGQGHFEGVVLDPGRFGRRRLPFETRFEQQRGVGAEPEGLAERNAREKRESENKRERK